MPTNRELVASLYAAFARGDAATVLAAFDPEIVWLEAEGNPLADCNPYVGPQQVGEGVFGRLMVAYQGFTVSPRVLHQDGDTVIAEGRYGGSGRATGLPLNAQFVHVWTLREGRVIGFQQYADTAQLVRVSGGAPAPMSAGAS
jgi:ketosteroid isomerase-like protein